MDLGAPSRAKRPLCELKMALYIQNLQKSGGGGTCPPVPTVPTSMIGTEFSRIHKDQKCLCYALKLDTNLLGKGECGYVFYCSCLKQPITNILGNVA